jgi:hypothetical protein
MSRYRAESVSMRGGGMLSLQEIHILDICIIELTRGTFGNYALSAAKHFLAILLLALIRESLMKHMAAKILRSSAGC